MARLFWYILRGGLLVVFAQVYLRSQGNLGRDAVVIGGLRSCSVVSNLSDQFMRC